MLRCERVVCLWDGMFSLSQGPLYASLSVAWTPLVLQHGCLEMLVFSAIQKGSFGHEYLTSCFISCSVYSVKVLFGSKLRAARRGKVEYPLSNSLFYIKFFLQYSVPVFVYNSLKRAAG